MTANTPLLSEATGLINALNPLVRGAQADLTDEVRSDLERLRVDVKAEAKKLLSEEIKAVEGPLPDSTRASYEWVLARIERVLAHGVDSLAEPVVPHTPPAAPKRTQPKK